MYQGLEKYGYYVLCAFQGREESRHSTQIVQQVGRRWTGHAVIANIPRNHLLR